MLGPFFLLPGIFDRKMERVIFSPAHSLLFHRLFRGDLRFLVEASRKQVAVLKKPSNDPVRLSRRAV
jgi:hypothetical protein